MKKDITNFNYKGQCHGYHEWYLSNKLALRCTYKNSIAIGYEEWHNQLQTRYYII